MKDITEKEVFSDRRFLNKGRFNSLAAISATLVEIVGEERLKWEPYYGSFNISSCNKTVELAIDLRDSESLENTIYKIKQIEEVSKAMREHLEGLREGMKQWHIDFKEVKNKKDGHV